jgi:hypothetical protein
MPIPVVPRLATRSPRAGRAARALSALIVLGMISRPVTGEGPATGGGPPAATDVARLAVSTSDRPSAPRLDAAPGRPEAAAALAEPMARARRMIADCEERYRGLRDYTCTFYKRERIDGRLTPQHVMSMKVRTAPMSIYVKLARPKTGREAIWVAGRNQGKALVHDVGIGKFLAGTVHVDPHSSLAMEDCRHPITEAGIGNLIRTVSYHWERELTPGSDTRVTINPDMRVGDRACTMIETTHPKHDPSYKFHSVKLYIDRELGLPIRIESYDWPHHLGVAPELVEEYTYAQLRLNVGLSERDFDPANDQYSFGRF